MGEYFNLLSDIRQYATRLRFKVCPVGDGSMVKSVDSRRFALPVFKSFDKKNTFDFDGCCLWNYLPKKIRDAHTISCFKS